MATPVKSDRVLTVTFDDSVTWTQAEDFVDRIFDLAREMDITIVARLDEEPVWEGEVEDGQA